MGLFVGNTFTYTKDVQSLYSSLDVYDTSEEENKELGNVVLVEDFNNRISEIKDDVDEVIKLIQDKYDTSTALDNLKILSEKLY